MRSWLSEAMGGLPPPCRGQVLSQEIKGIFLLESLVWTGRLDFTGALFTEFCGGGKKLFTLRSQFSLTAIPICL